MVRMVRLLDMGASDQELKFCKTSAMQRNFEKNFRTNWKISALKNLAIFKKTLKIVKKTVEIFKKSLEIWNFSRKNWNFSKKNWNFQKIIEIFKKILEVFKEDFGNFRENIDCFGEHFGNSHESLKIFKKVLEIFKDKFSNVKNLCTSAKISALHCSPAEQNFHRCKRLLMTTKLAKRLGLKINKVFDG